MRVDAGKKPVAFDNMQNRSIKGTTPWIKYEVVLDVPQEATAIAMGILLNGRGAAWISSCAVEEVGQEIHTTEVDPRSVLAPEPSNLNFESR